jgi:hypothetical protein
MTALLLACGGGTCGRSPVTEVSRVRCATLAEALLSRCGCLLRERPLGRGEEGGVEAGEVVLEPNLSEGERSRSERGSQAALEEDWPRITARPWWNSLEPDIAVLQSKVCIVPRDLRLELAEPWET